MLRLVILVFIVPSFVFASDQAIVYPLLATKLTSNFGKRTHPIYKYIKHHTGIDLKAPHDAKIRAIRKGTVVFAGIHGGYGKLITVEHEDGLVSLYGHCNKINVSLGDKIRDGQIIGEVGSTGNSTGPHLHLEIRKSGKAINPRTYLKGINVKAKG